MPIVPFKLNQGRRHHIPCQRRRSRTGRPTTPAYVSVAALAVTTRPSTPLSSSAPANRSVHHADLSVLSHGRILSARGRLITGYFDGSHGAHLVVVRGVAADADGAEEGS